MHKITLNQYNKLLANPQLDSTIKEQLRSRTIKDSWSFIGTDFS